MTDPNTPDDPDLRHGPDGPDFDDPLTADDIVNHPQDIPGGEARSGGDNQATRLVSLALAHYRLVQGEDSRMYVTEHDGPAVVRSLRGREGLRPKLSSLYFDIHHQAPGGAALTDALSVLEGMAERADREPVALRIAETGPQSIALDLATPDGRCVVVEPGGWRLADRSPVLFRRTSLTGALPVPGRAGSLDPLAELLNVDEARFRLIVAWLVAALMPGIPHPILALVGEQGTAKTTAARLVMSLVDASPAPVRTQPRDMRSWAAMAAASWIVLIDNVSSIPAWFSDTLCKAVTGDGIVERALHTDDDINIITFRRCIALTAIDAGRLAGDLAERLLTIELDVIPPERRRPDAEIAALYDTARPSLLGALLDLAAEVLAALPDVRLAELPRMADFARILGALDKVRGWSSLADYTAAAAAASQAVLDGDPVADAVLALIARQPVWSGTAGELLARLSPEHRPQGWPRTPQAISGALKRMAPALRASGGLTVEFPPRGQSRIITLRAADPALVNSAKSSSRSSRPSREAGDQA
jgi:hypothetical protein